VAPHSTKTIEIEFVSMEPETFKDFLILQVRGGDPVVLEIFAEVQSPSVSLNRVLMDIECLYSTNTYTFDDRAQ